MTERRRTNRIVLLLAALLLGLGLLANAQEVPDVIAGGATPYLVTYGDTVTFWAEVAVPQSTDSVISVWIVYEFFPLMALEEVDRTDTLTVWEGDWTVPNIPGILLPGHYVLSAVAVSAAGEISEPEPFILSITDHDPRVPELLSPPDRSAIFRGMPITFKWSSVPEATAYNFEIVFPDEEAVSVSLPFFFTSLTVEARLAAELPDGEYSWRVQATFSDGPGDWAAPFSFEKNSQHGPPIECEGFVTFVDHGLLQVESDGWYEDETDPGLWECWLVRVTEDTLITKEGEEIPLADIIVGDYVLVEGWEEDVQGTCCPVVTAERIEVTDFSWPEFVSGSVDEIMPEQRAFWLSELIYDPLGRIFVHLTGDAELTRMGRPIEFEEIQVGDLAVAMGTWEETQEGEYFLAESVDFSFGGGDWVSAEGTIERINHDESTVILSGTYSWGPNIVTQNRIVVSITRSTTIYRNDRPAGFGDLVVGDWALVDGTLMTSDNQSLPGGGNPGGTIEASSVSAYSARPNKP